jgi:hypothetical protein
MDKLLTCDEAYKEMLSGKKITHIHFFSDEYLYMDDNCEIKTEEGYNFSKEWINRTLMLAALNDLTWRSNWKIYN